MAKIRKRLGKKQVKIERKKGQTLITPSDFNGQKTLIRNKIKNNILKVTLLFFNS